MGMKKPGMRTGKATAKPGREANNGHGKNQNRRSTEENNATGKSRSQVNCIQYTILKQKKGTCNFKSIVYKIQCENKRECGSGGRG